MCQIARFHMQQVGKHWTTPEGVEAEPHPLWEYPSYPRSAVHRVMTFDFTQTIPSRSVVREKGEMFLEGPCHAVVLWMEYGLTGRLLTTTGLKTVLQEYL